MTSPETPGHGSERARSLPGDAVERVARAINAAAGEGAEELWDDAKLCRLKQAQAAISALEPDAASVEVSEGWTTIHHTTGRESSCPSVFGNERNDLFKRLLKHGTPINCLIGAARSVEGMDRYYGVPLAWAQSILEHAKKAEEAWNAIVEMFDEQPSGMLSEKQKPRGDI